MEEKWAIGDFRWYNGTPESPSWLDNTSDYYTHDEKLKEHYPWFVPYDERLYEGDLQINIDGKWTTVQQLAQKCKIYEMFMESLYLLLKKLHPYSLPEFKEIERLMKMIKEYEYDKGPDCECKKDHLESELFEI